MGVEKGLTELLNIISKAETDKRFILTIDGLSRSGKTTLTKELSQMLQERNIPVYVFHLDDYIVERKKRYNTAYEEWFEYYHLQWDIDWLKDNLFKKLKGSHQLNLPFYDNESDTHTTHNIKLPVAA